MLEIFVVLLIKKKKTSLTFYDTLGNPYTLDVTLTKDATTPNKWKIAIADKIKDTAGNVVEVKNASISPAELEFTENGTLKNNTQSLAISFGTTGGTTLSTGSVVKDITVDITGLTQYATASDLDPKTLNGNSAGTLSGYSIGADGVITATYSNGNKRAIAQVVVAEFDNPAGLEKVGDNLYTTTTNSGDFDGIGKAGVFNTGVLEMSNVDLSSEFTDMIITQRGFQANSRIISVSDEMLQELTNLKR